ncbi:hypothetical protein THAOC_10077 [Thalassiosira oceanica]|uniref:Uncharacterized protein n=1 Tax=Thalassiosira oceanica TaxID=159749 RepID=K0TDX7_THAOC|nr:hypothetical protein THAOC_10077 [Thalassiosira oceanica]|eukprot:EJK68722.1 hypothetical protein THAOC_10077 [Thalassiosira oceanica]
MEGEAMQVQPAEDQVQPDEDDSTNTGFDMQDLTEMCKKVEKFILERPEPLQPLYEKILWSGKDNEGVMGKLADAKDLKEMLKEYNEAKGKVLAGAMRNTMQALDTVDTEQKKADILRKLLMFAQDHGLPLCKASKGSQKIILEYANLCDLVPVRPINPSFDPLDVRSGPARGNRDMLRCNDGRRAIPLRVENPQNRGITGESKLALRVRPSKVSPSFEKVGFSRGHCTDAASARYDYLRLQGQSILSPEQCQNACPLSEHFVGVEFSEGGEGEEDCNCLYRGTNLLKCESRLGLFTCKEFSGVPCNGGAVVARGPIAGLDPTPKSIQKTGNGSPCSYRSDCISGFCEGASESRCSGTCKPGVQANQVGRWETPTDDRRLSEVDDRSSVTTLSESGKFGGSIAIQGSVMVVGAYEIDGGSVYVYEKATEDWPETQQLTADDAVSSRHFGFDVDMSTSGNLIIVGARYDIEGAARSGAAYIFEKTSNTWTQVAKLKAVGSPVEGSHAGSSVAIDGDIALVGAPRANTEQGLVYIFEREGGTWVEKETLHADEPGDHDRFGISVALSNQVAIIGSFREDDGGLSNSGAAYIYERQTDGQWVKVTKLHASDSVAGLNFGISVAIQGDRAVVGAYMGGTGAAYVFENQSLAGWTQAAKLTASDGAAGDRFGQSVALDGDAIAVSAPWHGIGGSAKVGATYIFKKQSSSWMEVYKFSDSTAAAESQIGFGLAISGDTLAVGTPDLSKLYLLDPYPLDPNAFPKVGDVLKANMPWRGMFAGAHGMFAGAHGMFAGAHGMACARPSLPAHLLCLRQQLQQQRGTVGLTT